MSAIPIRVRSVTARVVEHDWAWARDEAERIEANWQRRRALTPEIFDGPILLLRAIEQRGDHVEAQFFAARYRHLLGNLDLGGDGTVRNGFAMGVLRGSCGGLILGEMASYTANAGRLYFPAGTPDPADVTPDGIVDLTGNVLREIGEETGLGPDLLVVRDGWDILTADDRTSFFRSVDLAITAEEAAERIARHLAAEEKPELAGIRIVRRLGDVEAGRMPSFLPVYLEWLLAREAGLAREASA